MYSPDTPGVDCFCVQNFVLQKDGEPDTHFRNTDRRHPVAKYYNVGAQARQLHESLMQERELKILQIDKVFRWCLREEVSRSSRTSLRYILLITLDYGTGMESSIDAECHYACF